MSFILKLSAYTFLALMGLSAWRAGVEGWRYYFALVLFFFCVLRILMILRQRMNRAGASAAATTRLKQSPETPGDTHDNPPSEKQ